MKLQEYFLYAKKTKITTLFNNLSPPSQRSAILESIRWTQTAYAVLCQPHHTDTNVVIKAYRYVFYVYLCFDLNISVCVVRLTQNSVRSLRPADTLQNGATLTWRRRGGDELLNKVVIFVFFAYKKYSCSFIMLRLNH